MKYRFEELAFRNELVLERELEKLEFLKEKDICFVPRRYTVKSSTDAPFRVKIKLPNDVFLFQNKDDTITILMGASEESVQEFKKNNLFRSISIMLPKATKKDILNLMQHCEKENLYYKYKNSKDYSLSYINIDYLEDGAIIPYFYFWIRGNTKNFDLLNSYMGNRLVLTEYSDFGNIVDKDFWFLEKFTNFVNENLQVQRKEGQLNETFEEIINEIGDLDSLRYLMENYNYIMNDKQRKIIQDKLDLLNGETFHFEQDMSETFKSLQSDVLKLRNLTRMNRKEFAEYFGIPYRTVEDWENKKSTCSSYLFELMKFKIEKDFF